MSLQSDFEARFPEFVPLNQAAFDSAVAQQPCIYNAVYCTQDCTQLQLCDNEIILYLIAHLYALDTVASGGGTAPGAINNVASKSVGDESIGYQYGDTNSNTLFFNTTRYGQRYLLLTQKNQVGGYFV